MCVLRRASTIVQDGCRSNLQVLGLWNCVPMCTEKDIQCSQFLKAYPAEVLSFGKAFFEHRYIHILWWLKDSVDLRWIRSIRPIPLSLTFKFSFHSVIMLLTHGLHKTLLRFTYITYLIISSFQQNEQPASLLELLPTEENIFVLLSFHDIFKR